MKQRCNNPLHKWYANYGGRGIGYDPLWESFEGFLVSMGVRPKGYDLDRKDTSKGYTEDNCQWTPKAISRGWKC